MSFRKGIEVKNIKFVAALALSVAAVPAFAGQYNSKPIAAESDTIRYFKGVASITRETPTALITITPLENDNGRPAFAILYENREEKPINFGLENISVTTNGMAVPVLTKKQLAQKAANAAMWAQFGAALVAGVANADYGSTTTSGWVGRSYVNVETNSYNSNNWAARQDMKEMNAEIQAATEARLADAAQNVIDITTIDPGNGYGGKIILDKPKSKIWPAPITVTINGEAFQFTMTK